MCTISGGQAGCITEENALRRNPGFGTIVGNQKGTSQEVPTEEESQQRDHSRDLKEDASRGDIMEDESWRKNHGG